MKEYEVAEQFRTAFQGDIAFAGILLHNAQTGDTLARPSLVFDCKTKALNSSGTALEYALTVWVESSADRTLPTDPDPAVAHAARVAAVNRKLLGDGAPALLAALNQLAGYDYRRWTGAALEVDPAVQGNQWAVPVQIKGVVLAV